MIHWRWILGFLGMMLFPLFCSGGEPSPFRRDDELSGRFYCHKDREFIHRQTFRFRPQIQQWWARNPSGFRTTYGSRSSEEFYLFAEARKIWVLEDWLDAEMRFFQTEDLSGRYDRLLTGIGITPSPTWRIVTLGDVGVDKQDIDVHLETIWTPGRHHRVRLAAVVVDAMYLNRSFEGHYQRMPYTVFGQYMGRPVNWMELNFWININPDTTLEVYDESMIFHYRQLDAGMTATIPLAENWSTTFDGVFTQSERQWDSSATGANHGSFRRQFHNIGVELWREPPAAFSG